MSRSRRGIGVVVAAACTIALSLATAGPVRAAASPEATRYIVFVDYFSDASHSQLVGSYTWSDCPGEQGHWGWGAQTSYHVITSEECP